MMIFRLVLVVMIMAVSVYTSIVGVNHGWNLVPIFFNDLLAMTWPGQFNSDFMCFLILSGLWTAWRNHFSPAGLLLGVMAFFFGILFLATYLFILSFVEKGNIEAMLLKK